MKSKIILYIINIGKYWQDTNIGGHASHHWLARGWRPAKATMCFIQSCPKLTVETIIWSVGSESRVLWVCHITCISQGIMSFSHKDNKTLRNTRWSFLLATNFEEPSIRCKTHHWHTYRTCRSTARGGRAGVRRARDRRNTGPWRRQPAR